MSLSVLEIWEERLSRVLSHVDVALEERFGSKYPLRRNRPLHGSTANSKYSGLFSMEAKFSLGYTSGSGPGYIIQMRTLSAVPISEEDRQLMLEDAEDLLKEALKEEFPEKDLYLDRQEDVFLLSGDLSL